jgi:hypothetical protein
MDSIRKFKSYIISWRFGTIIVVVIGLRGVGDSKSEKQLFITNGEGEFDQDVFAIDKNFRTII